MGRKGRAELGLQITITTGMTDLKDPASMQRLLLGEAPAGSSEEITYHRGSAGHVAAMRRLLGGALTDSKPPHSPTGGVKVELIAALVMTDETIVMKAFLPKLARALKRQARTQSWGPLFL